jgi:hypothetical protein
MPNAIVTRRISSKRSSSRSGHEPSVSDGDMLITSRNDEASCVRSTTSTRRTRSAKSCIDTPSIHTATDA